MEVVWCRICETNRKLSCIDDGILGCNVCGLVVRPDDVTPEQHPVLFCAQNLGIFDESAVKYAMFCYKKAASGYFRGGDIIAAICLYIGSCTNIEVPVMLFDFSMYLRVSVYHVGLLFLNVCMVLSDEVDGFKTVDPVFFIHRFTFALFKENKINFIVVLTALRILADFKSDYVGCWKRLGGLCAAAVYMAAIFNGFDVLDFDHVAPAFRGVLREKKLVECRITDWAVEFRSVAEEYEYLEYLSGDDMTRNVDALCPHNVDKFCRGFCHVCYDKFVKLSGYFCGGLDVKKCRKCRLTDLENGIVVPREDDDVQVLCGKKRLSSMINFDALREAFGDDAQSTDTKFKESNMEQGQAREENRGDELAICGNAHAQGREDSSNKDDQREEVLANKNNSVRRRFGQPKRPWLRRLGLQR